jgi:hypothetical protein
LSELAPEKLIVTGGRVRAVADRGSQRNQRVEALWHHNQDPTCTPGTATIVPWSLIDRALAK